ncbi:MAG: OmpA family protein [Bacteroidaceae bacterium]|nr:OmpA family protein [Bacteroidaceae bacterium]
MYMKKIFAVIALALGCSLSGYAQDAEENADYRTTPYNFVGLQAGLQTTFTNYDQAKLLTPTASVSLGRFFTPLIGARLHVNGMWNKGGIKPGFTYDYNYVTTDLDLLLNLCTLFGNRTYYPLNVYLIGGIGLNYAWNNDDINNSVYILPDAWEDDFTSHNLRLGAMFDYDLCKNWSVNLEVSANSLSDRYNSKTVSTDDWQLTAQVGLAYKFSCKAKPAPEPVYVAPVEEVIEEPVEEVVPVEPAPKPVEVAPAPEMRTEIFYAIRQTTITRGEQAKVDNLVSFLKDNPTTKVSVTGYADAGTGNPRINLKYSQQRAENVAKALVEAGISADRITVDYKGDTVQPFSENDKNRVTIAVAKE